jgi:hypothetical protein
MKNSIYACILLLAGLLCHQAEAAGNQYEYEVVTDITIALTLTAQDGATTVTNGTRVTQKAKLVQHKITNRTIIDATAVQGRPFSPSAKLVAVDGEILVLDAAGGHDPVSTGIYVAWMLPGEDVPYAGVYTQTYANGIRKVRDGGKYVTPSCLLLGDEPLMVGLEKGSYTFKQPKDGLFPAEGGGWQFYWDGAGYWLYKGEITVAGPSQGLPNSGWLEGMWPIEGKIKISDRAIKTQVAEPANAYYGAAGVLGVLGGDLTGLTPVH